MNRLIKTHWDKLLLALAVGAVTASSGWMWRQQPVLRRLHAQAAAGHLPPAPYAPGRLQSPGVAAGVWPDPPEPSRADGWRYEVFTPPVIYYDPSARSFTVTMPRSSTKEAVPFGLVLREVKPEPFRLQLAGYYGGPGDYLVAFVSPDRPGIRLIRPGDRLEDLALWFTGFAVTKVRMPSNGAGPVYDVIACARLRDERTDTEVELDNRALKYTDTALAVCQPPGGGSEPCELRAGETFADDISTYRVERIQLDPPEVVVVKQTPGRPLPEVAILHPRTESEPTITNEEAVAGSFPVRPPTGLATNSN